MTIINLEVRTPIEMDIIKRNWILYLIVGLFAFGIMAIISTTATNDLTTNESTLLSVLLTVLSIIGSLIVSSYFSKNTQKEAIEEVKTEHQNNLRTYALNAAEKVNNLSNELSKLALYLRSEIEQNDDSDEFAYYSKVERIESAIHIVNTLKSVNDTSLSDWKGVIGDELEEIEEEKEEREERLLEISEKFESIIQNQNNGRYNSEITGIKKQLEQLVTSINLPPIQVRPSSKDLPKVKVEQKCPNCEESLIYTQKENIRGYKTIKCLNCGKRTISKYSPEKGFYVKIEHLIKEAFNCPWCDTVNEKEISNFPTREIIECIECNDKMKVSRKFNMGLSIISFGNSSSQSVNDILKYKNIISDELLDEVEAILPKQPWVTGIHKIIAPKLNISNSIAHRCISELIRQEKYNPQINGNVYVKRDLPKENINDD